MKKYMLFLLLSAGVNTYSMNVVSKVTPRLTTTLVKSFQNLGKRKCSMYPKLPNETDEQHRRRVQLSNIALPGTIFFISLVSYFVTRGGEGFGT